MEAELFRKKQKRERNKLRKVCREVLDAGALKTVEALIDNASFMSVCLEELQDDIIEKGYIEEYQNGDNQYGIKESTEIKTYNQLIRNYNTCIKSIISVLPATTSTTNADDPLLAFLKNSK